MAISKADLLKVLAQYPKSLGKQLPGSRRLAKTLQCSAPTVLKLLRDLERDGLLVRIDRSGRFKWPGLEVAAKKEKVPRLEYLTEMISQDLLQGNLKGDSKIPSLRSLMLRYHASFDMIKVALERLSSQGIIQPLSRTQGFRFSPCSRHSETRVIICVRHDLYFIDNPYLRRLAHGIESQLQKEGWDPPQYVWLNDIPSLSRIHRLKASAIIVLEGNAMLFALLSREKKIPVVYIHTDGDERTPRKTTSPKRWDIHVDHYGAGMELGRHLVEKGHRNFAYFSDLLPEKGWSALRRKGLTEAIKNESACVIHYAANVNDILGAPAIPHDYLYIPQLKAILRRSKLFSQSSISLNMAPLFHIHHWMRWAPRLWPNFVRACRRKDHSAWIGSHDDLALMMMAFFLNSENPGKVPLIFGFDNSLRAQANGLGSYDFGFDKIGELAVRILVYGSTKKQWLVSGTLMPR